MSMAKQKINNMRATIKILPDYSLISGTGRRVASWGTFFSGGRGLAIAAVLGALHW